MIGTKNIIPVNKNGQLHGYCIYYWRYSTTNIMSEGYNNNGNEVGYWKDYDENGELERKTYYIL